MERLGWKLHRIWSTDWFTNRNEALEKAEQAILQAAKAVRDEDEITLTQSAQITRNETQSPTEALSRPYEMARIEIKYNLYDWVDIFLIDSISEIVQVESPMHLDEVALRIANAAGYQRAGKRIRELVRKAAESAVHEKRLIRKGEFLWISEHAEVIVRNRQGMPPSLQRSERIAPEEIAAAFEKAIKASCGIDEQGAIRQAASLFGFKRVGKDIRSRFESVLKQLIKSGELKRSGDWIMYA